VAIKKSNKKQSTLMKIGTVIICVILAMGLMIPAGVSLVTCASQTGTPTSNTQNQQGAIDTGTEANTISDIPDTSDTSGASTSNDLDLAGMYLSSLERHQQAIKDDPGSYPSYESLGNVAFDWAVAIQNGEMSPDPYTTKELYTIAIEAYTRRLELQSSPNVSVDRAIATFYSGDVDKAIDLLEAYTAEDAYFAPAWANLGKFYESDGQYDKARTSYQKALDSNPDDSIQAFAQDGLANLP